ncbi:MAG TPA: ABC transporter permease subunit [bacterium]|jgi:ABC-2 type transport system permease protein|nr:ABC transporter permease subunit [bacterium]
MSSNITPIYLRELKSAFYSPVAWIVLAVYFLSGGFFWLAPVAQFARYSAMYANRGADLKFGEMVLSPYFMNQVVMFIFLMPLVSMRLLSEEKRGGTIETLFTLPFSDLDIVLGKWFASLTLLAAMLAPTLVYMAYLVGETVIPWPVVATGFFGMFVLGGACLALGLLLSALTENQIIAGILGFVILLMLFVLNWIASLTSGVLKDVIDEVALSGHMQSLAKGLINLKDLSYFALFIVLMLFGTLRVLESKKWR